MIYRSTLHRAVHSPTDADCWATPAQLFATSRSWKIQKDVFPITGLQIREIRALRIHRTRINGTPGPIRGDHSFEPERRHRLLMAVFAFDER